MNFSQLLLILRARFVVVLLMLATTVCTTIGISMLLPKSYVATTTIVINYKGVDPVTGYAMPNSLMPGYMATQMDIIKSTGVALRVVDALELVDSPLIRQNFMEATDGAGDIRQWLASLLLKNLDVAPGRESSVVGISFKGSDPRFAATVANAFATEYQKMSVQLKVEPLKQASQYFDAQLKTLGEDLREARSRLSRYQQEKGLVSVDDRFDIESARLHELSTQLVEVQGQLMAASSRYSEARGPGASESPDIVGNPLIQNLKASLAEAEAHFAEISQRLAENHPTYQSARAELETLRARLQHHIQLTSSSVGNSKRILQHREAEVHAALDAQKKKVLELNRVRDELAVLARDVESARHAYEATVKRFNETSLEGQANQADVAVLSRASPPVKAASPKVLVNALLSAFVGIMLGVGCAVVVELLDRRIRSEEDLEELLRIPVLGLIDLDRSHGADHYPNRAFRRPQLGAS